MRPSLVLWSLLLAGSLSQCSQYLLPFLYSVSPDRGDRYSLRAALGLAPALFSILVGYASGAPRGLTQLLAGQLALRRLRSRALVLAGSLAFQALGTLILSVATEKSHVIISQIVVGLGSGPLYPLGYSILANVYDALELGAPNGVFSQTAYFGPALASLCVVFATRSSWRCVCFLLALSLLMAAFGLACLLTFQDETLIIGKEKKSTSSVLLEPPRRRSLMIALLAAGGGARYAAGYAVPSYLPLFFAETYPNNSSFSSLNAIAIFAFGSTSALLGGTLAQAYAAKSKHFASGLFVVPVISCLLGGFFASLTFLSPTFEEAVVFLFFMQFSGEAWLAGTVAAIRVLAQEQTEAALGIFYATATAVGSANLLLLGKTFREGSRQTMLLAVASPYFLSAIFFLITALLATQSSHHHHHRRRSGSDDDDDSSCSTRKKTTSSQQHSVTDSTPLLRGGAPVVIPPA